MILEALITAFFFAGLVAVVAIPWMTVPTYEKVDHHAHDHSND
jgi:hypothetical protein